MPYPLQFLLVSLAGWINRNQFNVIRYQRAEIRVLREQCGKRRLVFTNAQRRLLARLGKVIGRKRTPTWAEFLAIQGSALAAADFFTVEVLTLFGIVRYHVFFVMEVATRRVQIAGIVANPTGLWLTQIVRNLTDCFSGFLLGKRHLILDRDPLYTKVVRALLRSSGVKVVRLPRESPNLNAHAERFVLSIKSECLRHMILFGEDHLRRVVAEYMEHYHNERPHQGLGGRLIEPDARVLPAHGKIVCRQRLGGLLRSYYRQAA